MANAQVTLAKLRRAIRPGSPWWPFPLWTQRGLYGIFAECHDALSASMVRIEELEADNTRLRLEVSAWATGNAVIHDVYKAIDRFLSTRHEMDENRTWFWDDDCWRLHCAVCHEPPPEKEIAR